MNLSRKRKKIEFSKLIMLVASALNIIVIIFSMIMVIVMRDTSPLSYLIPSIGAEVAAGSAFYYNKAKAENKIKLMQKYKVSPSNEDFNIYS